MSSSDDLSASKKIALVCIVLATGVWIIVEALVFGTVREPHYGGQYVSFEEAPITFLFMVGIGFVVVGWSIRALRVIISEIRRKRG